MKMVKNDDRPLKIINTFENKSAAVIRLSNFDNTFLYVLKYIDKDISSYLIESEEAVNFYYTVENQSLGIRISFALYIILAIVILCLCPEEIFFCIALTSVSIPSFRLLINLLS